ncbi:pyridoxal phosphate-dependent aminotransferase [Micromonospora sp. WMMA1363]|uniref:pyridoxal phosphate-dependent aminotransferase n=1 Tax=Micromonospora sp. WMMA1363 TaxID=3053985 RepID=UPI00259C84EE|nr:pyridoxal phosphate-dependent aminotransferase [Micromonospora sp. WMMA1363]MDM4721513.1 pyridoxal phosphate-dependent aminotransferase [Micromonospora sp. WMMA1363]
MTTVRRDRVGQRAAGLRDLILAPMIQLARELDAVDIAIGTPPGEPPAAAVSAATRAMRSGLNQYTDPSGLPRLRQMLADRIASRNGTHVDPTTELTVTTGSTEAVLVALLTVTDPGDEVIVVEPAFETYSGAVRLAGCTMVPVGLRNPGWRLDTDRLAAAFTERTAAVIVNTPHNPTGRVFSRAEMAGLLTLCEQHGAVCVSDEVYADFVFDRRAHVSALDFPGHRERVIVSGSLSKANEMAGWRIGYCIAAPDITAVLRKVHERTSFSTSTPLQHGAAAVADVTCRPEQFENRRQEMVDRLRDMGFDVYPPEGGWFVMAGTAPLGLDAEQLGDALLRTARVLVAPGTPFFGNPVEGRLWIRTTFVKDPVRQTAALDAMGAHLAAVGKGSALR